jgi:phosphoribosyl 1,2-cyclic phosphodiesterase
MQLQILGSNSKGNCYLIQAEDEVLIIEAGVKLAEVKQALNFDLSKIVALLVSHAHNDHAGYIRDYMAAGILTLALEEVFQSKKLGVLASFRKTITAGHGYKVGNYKVYAFEVSHDVPCLGFLIDHPESGKILFLTDTMTCEFAFPGLHHVMIECNYADDILDAKIASGKVPISMRPRLLATHMELESTKHILMNQDILQIRNIILIHLSDGNSNEKRFVNEVKELTGKNVFAANKGMIINLSKTPF